MSLAPGVACTGRIALTILFQQYLNVTKGTLQLYMFRATLVRCYGIVY